MQIKRLAAALAAALTLGTLTACKMPAQGKNDTPVSEKAVFSVPAAWTKTTTAGVYTCGDGMDFPDATAPAFSIRDKVFYYDFVKPSMDFSDDTVVLRDAVTLEELRREDFGGGTRRVLQMAGGGFAVMDTATATVTDYAARDAKKTVCKGAAADKVMDALLSPSGKTALCQSADDGKIFLYDLKAQKDIPLSGINYGFLLGVDDTAYYVDGNDNQLWKISEDGKAEVSHFRPSARLCLPYIVESNEMGYIVQHTGTGSLLSFRADTEKETVVAAGEGYLLSQSDDGIRIYNLHTGKYTATYALSGTYMAAAYTDGYFGVLTFKDGKFYTAAYVLSELAFSETTTGTGNSYEDFESVYYDKYPTDAATEQLLADIYQKYHVRVILKSSKFEKEILGYCSKPIADVDIPEKVKAVDHFLSLLPAGMTGEIYSGADIWVYLGNDLHTIDGDSHVEGFASVFCGHPFIAMCSEGVAVYFEETLAHEFSHLIDYRETAAWLEGWEKLSPADGYAKRMTNLSGKYTPYAMDGSDVYYYDIYSTTFPTEDRAVIFEKLFYEYVSGERQPDLHRPHVVEKVAYYRRMLRANFPSCAKADTLFWEDKKFEG